jgi:hypothetical protein
VRTKKLSRIDKLKRRGQRGWVSKNESVEKKRTKRLRMNMLKRRGRRG